MASSRAHSAALLISVYVDADGGAPWYAQLRAFDDPAAAGIRMERVSDKAALILAIKSWLDDVLGER